MNTDGLLDQRQSSQLSFKKPVLNKIETYNIHLAFILTRFNTTTFIKLATQFIVIKTLY